MDSFLSGYALKSNAFVVVDVNVRPAFPELKRSYEHRYVHMPYKEASACLVASGLASRGKRVVIVGLTPELFHIFDDSLNIKLLPGGEWLEANLDRTQLEQFESRLVQFGVAILD